MIKADGGTGDFTTVTLDTAAYEALYAKRADFVITFTAWEGIEARPARHRRCGPSRFTDYGFPDFYQVVLACDRRWLDREPDLAQAFVGAPLAGFEFAADRPGRRGRRSWSRRTRASSTATRTSRPRASGSSPSGGYLRRRRGRGRDARRSSGGRATRASSTTRACSPTPNGKPLRRAARLRGAVHERLPAVTDRGDRRRRWVPPVAPRPRRWSSLWEALRPAGRASTRSCCRRRRGSSRRCGTSGARAASHLVPTLVETIVGVARLGGARRSPRPSRSIVVAGPARGRAAARRRARRSRSSRSPRCS